MEMSEKIESSGAEPRADDRWDDCVGRRGTIPIRRKKQN
jgi:hypothetical protein